MGNSNDIRQRQARHGAPTLTLCGLLAGMIACACAGAQAAPTTLIEWSFDQPGKLEGWGRPSHITELRVEDGAMCGTITDRDPFVTSPQFDIGATPWQSIKLRLRTNCGGGAQVFWTNTTETKYGGFSSGKNTTFTVTGDGEWHEYRIRPYWHTEKRIILLRLDLPMPKATDGPHTFAVDYIRIVGEEPGPAATRTEWDFADPDQAWAEDVDAPGSLTPGPVRIPVEDRFWLSVEMSAERGQSGYVRWVSDEHASLNQRRFLLRPDGEMHVYNVDMSGARQWSGELLMLGLTPSATEDDEVVVRRISISEEPLGPPNVTVTWAGLEETVNRVGSRVPLGVSLSNTGGELARELRIAELRLPEGVSVVSEDDWRALPEVQPSATATHRVELMAAAPVTGEVEIRLVGEGAPSEPVTASIVVTPGLGLPPADYVPEPEPVKSDYEIGAYYYPGWQSMAKWDRVRRPAPERKPVLGWYDEANPECVDWQIKWAVEHGISFFMVDWYWAAGTRHNEHWLEAFAQARHRKYLKWCIMWANHNRPGTHSEDDQRAVTQYWLDHCFNMPEYYRIDGKPVVIIWSPARMRKDMGGSEGLRRLLDISREMVKAAGYDDICFVAMKWPEASTDAPIIAGLADEGFDMTTIYHYMGHGGMAEDPKRYPFELVAESTLPFLQTWRDAHPLPFMPALSTGWDSQPWHGDRATTIYGRSVELFRGLCEDVRQFADESGLRRLALGPLNEWGEGSYIEPCAEFGFEMYDVVRDTFCERPADGWPPNIAPTDVGLGPYDFPTVEPRTAWDFDDGAQGWGPAMGVGDFAARDGAISCTTTSRDPALSVTLNDLPARAWAAVVIRMSIDATGRDGERAQLFWSTTTAKASEATSISFELTGDGEMHEYLLPVSENARWRGTLTGLRFDPCSHAGATVTVDEVRLVAASGDA